MELKAIKVNLVQKMQISLLKIYHENIITKYTLSNPYKEPDVCAQRPY